MLTTVIPTLVIVSGLAFVLLVWQRQDANTRRRLRLELQQAWGRAPAERTPATAIPSIASYFANGKRTQPDRFAIDDITWSDLELDDVFRRLNATCTSAGEEVLYRWLRESGRDAETLAKRIALVERFQTSPDGRLAVQLILSDLGKRRFVDVTDYLFDDQPVETTQARLYVWLAAAALISPLVFFSHTLLGTLLTAGTFLMNALVYYRRRAGIEAELERLGQLVRIVKCGQRLGRSRIPGLEPQLEAFAASTAGLASIAKRGFYVGLRGTGALADIVGEYIRIVLLKELIDYEHLRRDVVRHRETLLDLYELLGGIDAALAVASFRDSLPFWTTPAIDWTGARASVEFFDLFHPMIDVPVSNSRTIGRPLLVTGSNASGKSTFLKALAINAILAQSIGTVCARRYEAPRFLVLSSMALKDSVLSGESYYTAELRSVRRLLDPDLDGHACLCVIDEVLRGTNTVERIAAASAILEELAARDRLCVAATHDGELVTLLGDRFENVHFTEAVTKDGVSFNYRLAEGPATSRNAIRLLGVLGYPSNVVEQARSSVRGFLATGRWSRTGGS